MRRLPHHLSRHGYARLHNQKPHRHADALKRPGPITVIENIVPNPAQQQNDEKRRKNHPHRSRHRPFYARLFISCIGGAVNGNGAGGGLRNYRNIHHLIQSKPLLSLNTLMLNQGNHGVPAAKGKHPDSGKRQKQVQKYFHHHSSFCVLQRPKRPVYSPFFLCDFITEQTVPSLYNKDNK